MKTFDEYMNHPEIVDEPMALREIHAIRLMQQDKMKDMTPEQRWEYIDKKTADFFSQGGTALNVADFSTDDIFASASHAE